MGLSKTDEYKQTEIAMADVLKAMGHPARLAIISELVKRKTCVCGELVNTLPLAQATVSQHLKALKNAGVIQGTITGTNVCYCLNPKTFEKLKKYLDRINNQLVTNSCC
ncbi:MAG: hypothetical protein RIR06_1032 [Bacteroidota bacterium]|jgi:predicted transcriptional regulator